MKKSIIAVALVALGLGSMAQAQVTDPADEGLVEVRKGALKHTFVNPEADLSEYTKVMILPADFEFRPVKRAGRVGGFSRSNQSVFWLSDRDKEKAIDNITRVFEDTFAKSKIEIVDEPGEGVVLIRGGFYDMVNRVPQEPIGASYTYVRSAGAATIVVEGRDSVTGEVLYRAEERREIQRPGRDLFDANRVSTNAELRRWARRFATKIVGGLEDAHS